VHHAADRRQERQDGTDPSSVTDRFPELPLTAALLDAADKGLSFATPGHRCGRSCTPVLAA
jgi:hypothetical protein